MKLSELIKKRDELNIAIKVLQEHGTPRRAGVDSLGRKRRVISPAGRKAMSAGMRRYWAQRKAKSKTAGTKQ